MRMAPIFHFMARISRFVARISTKVRENKKNQPWKKPVYEKVV